MFYRLILLELKPHKKGLIVETALLLDPNIENLKDIETSLEDQVSLEADTNQKIMFQARKKSFGGWEFGKFGFYVEEYKAAPHRFLIVSIILCSISSSRFCKYLNRQEWSKDRILDLNTFLK